MINIACTQGEGASYTHNAGHTKVASAAAKEGRLEFATGGRGGQAPGGGGGGGWGTFQGFPGGISRGINRRGGGVEYGCCSIRCGSATSMRLRQSELTLSSGSR